MVIITEGQDRWWRLKLVSGRKRRSSTFRVPKSLSLIFITCEANTSNSLAQQPDRHLLRQVIKAVISRNET